MKTPHIPLFIVTGASGSGKTFIIPELRKLLSDCDVFDVDIIWDGQQDWQIVKRNWLRIAYSIAQSGRFTVLCGTMLPWELEQCDKYEFFSPIYYVNLHCDDDIRRERILARGWAEEQVREHTSFAKWLLENANSKFDPPMPTVDTTHTIPKDVAQQISTWVRERTDSLNS